MFDLVLFRYDHLARVLTKVLDERPENPVDIFEDISNAEKRNKFTSDVDTVQDKVDKTTEVALAEIQEKLFKVCMGDSMSESRSRPLYFSSVKS